MSPTRPTAHDHALSVETLAEKDARLRREQGLPPTSDLHRCPPLPCFWHEDAEGTRYLIPGCMARINDPDIDECDCPRINDQLTAARDQIAALERAAKGLQGWHDQIVAAVYAHRDGIEIMRVAAEKSQTPRGGQ